MPMVTRLERRSFIGLGVFTLCGVAGCRPNRMPDSFTCHHCGKVHDGLPLAFSTDAPDHYYGIPESERVRRAVLSSDQCIIDNEHYFARGCLDIRINDSAEIFTWGIWVSLSERNFQRMTELWDKEGRESEPAYFGWLCTRLPGYPDTTNLKTHVHTRPIGQRPFVELEPTEHPLAVEQRTGITLARARQIAENLLHGS